VQINAQISSKIILPKKKERWQRKLLLLKYGNWILFTALHDMIKEEEEEDDEGVW
jgi:hypothetical protein